MTSATQSVIVEVECAACPRCRTPLTMAGAFAALEQFGGDPSAFSSTPETPLLAQYQPFMPWVCDHCGEDSELPDFRGEEHTEEDERSLVVEARRTASWLEARRWRRWAVTHCGDTPAARAASDEDLAHQLDRRLQQPDAAPTTRRCTTKTPTELPPPAAMSDGTIFADQTGDIWQVRRPWRYQLWDGAKWDSLNRRCVLVLRLQLEAPRLALIEAAPPRALHLVRSLVRRARSAWPDPTIGVLYDGREPVWPTYQAIAERVAAEMEVPNV